MHHLISFVGGTSQLLWLLLAAGITGFAAAILVAVFAEKGEHPTFRMTRCSMGFFVAVVWIMAIADEVVNVLQVRESSSPTAVHLHTRLP